MQQSAENGDFVIVYSDGFKIGSLAAIARPLFTQQTIQPSPVEGSAHWAKLHTAESPGAEWLTRWLTQIPSYGCSCHKDFHKILAANPPRFNDWFRWSVEVHNAVNEKLGKPVWTIDEALAIWRRREFQWKQVDGLRVGFLASGLSVIGGTETFHQTLVPRLASVIGFATPGMMLGDWRALGVPAYSGYDAIKSLCSQSDVIVSWLVNPRDFGFTGKVIMVHHGPPRDIEQNESSLVGDEIVCVSKATADHLRTLTDKPVRYIPNAVDPARIVARNAIDLPEKKLCVWLHRFAADKRPELAIEIARHLPDDWHMVLAGGGQKLTGSDRVTILSPVHPGDLLTRASCFLSTSRFDGFGLSVAEAIEAGVPVVSSPAGIATEPGLATIVEHDASPQEWADAIVTSANLTTTRPQLPAEYQLSRHIEAWARVIG